MIDSHALEYRYFLNAAGDINLEERPQYLINNDFTTKDIEESMNDD